MATCSVYTVRICGVADSHLRVQGFTSKVRCWDADLGTNCPILNLILGLTALAQISH